MHTDLVPLSHQKDPSCRSVFLGLFWVPEKQPSMIWSQITVWLKIVSPNRDGILMFLTHLRSKCGLGMGKFLFLRHGFFLTDILGTDKFLFLRHGFFLTDTLGTGKFLFLRHVF